MAAELTQNQIQLIEESFAAVAPQGAELVASFYDRLFNDFPAVKPMFANTTPAEQQKKLLSSLVLVVQNLRKPEVLGPALEQLGARHNEYGAVPTHYDAVGSTLLDEVALELAVVQPDQDVEPVREPGEPVVVGLDMRRRRLSHGRSPGAPSNAARSGSRGW